MKFVELSSEDFDQWIKKLGKSNHLQSIDMAHLKEKRGRKIHFVGLEDDYHQVLEAALLAALPTRVGKAYEIEGWLPSSAENSETVSAFLKALQTYVKNNGGISLLIKPDVPYVVTDVRGENPKFQNESLIEIFQKAGYSYHKLDLRPEFAGFDWNYKKDLKGVDPSKPEKSYLKGAQQSLKQAHHYPTVVREITGLEEMPRFYACYEKTCHRLGISPKEYIYFEQVYQTMGDRAQFILAEIDFKAYQEKLQNRRQVLKEELDALEADLALNPNSRKKNNQHRETLSQYEAQGKRLVDAKEWIDQATEEKTVLAVALFIISPYELTYLYSGSNEEYSLINAPYLIQDQTIRLALDKKIPVYNFLGISEPFDENNGLFRFKVSFNGYAERTMGTFTWSPHPTFLKVYEKVKRLLGRYDN